MRPSATLTRFPQPPGGAEEPRPALTLYLCKELFVVLLGVGRGPRQASLRLVGEGGLGISASGLLNASDALWVFSLYGGESGPLSPVCAPEIPFQTQVSPSFAPEAPPGPLTSRPKPHVPCPGTTCPAKSSRGRPAPLDQTPVAPPTPLPLVWSPGAEDLPSSLSASRVAGHLAPAHLALLHLGSGSQTFLRTKTNKNTKRKQKNDESREMIKI